MSRAEDATLELTKLRFTHPGGTAPTLAGIDLQVPSGDMLAVVGPSGSGKTSLLRVTAGLEQPEAGDVLVAGASQLGIEPERRTMSMMFQRPLLFPHLNVLDNVAFADRVTGATRARARRRAHDFLELVHLSQLASRPTHVLSGGQEQRVALARALAARPRVLLLDEPFSALDSGLRGSMHELLSEVRAVLGPTTVMVTHDLDEAALADRVAVLVGGAVRQVGSVAELYRRPASLDVARVLGGFAELVGEVVSGSHRSAFGDLPLTRQEQADDAVCRSAGRAPAALLVRREALRATSVDDPASVLTAVVSAVRQRGPRESVVVEPDQAGGSTGQARLEVEVPVGDTLRGGARIGVARTGIPVTVLRGDAAPTLADPPVTEAAAAWKARPPAYLGRRPVARLWGRHGQG